MGAAVFEQINHRPLSHLGRSPSIMVITSRSATTRLKFHHPISQFARPTPSEALTIGPVIKLQIPRTHRPHHLSRLERRLSKSDHHLQHRHHLHNLGHSIPHRQNPTHCPRQRSLRRPLLRPERRCLRQLRRRRKRAHVRSPQPRTQHHHLRAVGEERQKW